MAAFLALCTTRGADRALSSPRLQPVRAPRPCVRIPEGEPPRPAQARPARAARQGARGRRRGGRGRARLPDDDGADRRCRCRCRVGIGSGIGIGARVRVGRAVREGPGGARAREQGTRPCGLEPWERCHGVQGRAAALGCAAPGCARWFSWRGSCMLIVPRRHSGLPCRYDVHSVLLCDTPRACPC